MQIDNAMIDQITQSVVGAFGRVGDVRGEVEDRVRSVIQDALGRFDLVTGEEFDVAKQLLANTRIKVDALEKRLAELEASMKMDAEEEVRDNPEKKTEE